MKRIHWFLLAIASITLLILLFSYINRDRMMDRMIEMAMDRATFKTEYLDDMDGIRVFTLGTASPIPDDYNQTGTAVFAGGFFFLFDVGDGVVKEAEKLRLPLPSLSAVFISHWHSDHYIELPHVINRTWQLGRSAKLDVHGPKGLDSILFNTHAFLLHENLNRVAHHGDSVMNTSIAGTNAFEIETGTQDFAVLFEKNDVKITTFEVCHPPIEPSYGFKIEYKGKSLVISGDTKEDCDNVKRFAAAADMLIHEAMLKDVFFKSSEMNNGASNSWGNRRNAKIAEDITEYHTSPLHVGKLANEAQVKSLVLNHFAPVPSNIILSRRYRFAVRRNYKGPLKLAKDGSEYYID